MLMSAGLGTRMMPFTDNIPKPFLPLLGVPMVQFCLDHAFANGISKVVMNIHHHADRACKEAETLEIAKH